MNTPSWRWNLNSLKTVGAIVSVATILIGSAIEPLSAQVIIIENGQWTAIYPSSTTNSSVTYISPVSVPVNSSIIYPTPVTTTVNSSITYTSPVPSSVFTYPTTNVYSYPSYYTGSIIRVRKTTPKLTKPVLANPIIRDSKKLIDPTTIEVQPRKRYGSIPTIRFEKL